MTFIHVKCVLNHFWGLSIYLFAESELTKNQNERNFCVLWVY